MASNKWFTILHKKSRLLYGSFFNFQEILLTSRFLPSGCFPKLRTCGPRICFTFRAAWLEFSYGPVVAALIRCQAVSRFGSSNELHYFSFFFPFPKTLVLSVSFFSQISTGNLLHSVVPVPSELPLQYDIRIHQSTLHTCVSEFFFN